MLQLPTANPYWSITPEALAQLLHRAGPPPQVEAALRDRAADDLSLPFIVRDGVAIIRIAGPLLKSDDWLTKWLGGTSYVSVQRAIGEALGRSSVKTILLQVDSPGGSVDGLAELGDAVRAARRVKPVIAQVAGMAASAAYYVAAQASQVFAGRMDLVGSIGTVLSLYDYSRQFEKLGIEPVILATGEYKAAGEPGTEITTRQRRYFQSIVDGFFTDFRRVVVQGRGGGILENLGEVTTGKLYLAQDAMRLGLIDGIRTMDDTLRQLRPPRRRSRAEIEVALMDM